MAPDTPMSRMFFVWDDEKFLRDVERALATGKRMESWRTGTLHVFLALAVVQLFIRGFWWALVS